MATRINAGEMDFEKIKVNLINYMKSQNGPVGDYDYEGSAVNTIMDVLSYITHMNAVNANLALNETFLDTSQLRESVVSHAKLLGYTPRSRTAAIANIDFVVTGDSAFNVVNGVPQQLTIPYGTLFHATRGNKKESFSLLTELRADPVVSGSGHTWTFSGVDIHQGVVATRQYSYNSDNAEHYILQDANVDLSTLLIDVQVPGSTAYTDYHRSSNIVNVTNTSKAYFVEETRNGFYEVKFGDGYIGVRPNQNDIIRMRYLVVGSNNVNGSNSFSIGTSILGSTSTVVSAVNLPAAGGALRETIDSIKHNAPRTFTSQNRLVTPEDYKSTLQNEYSNAKTVSVWGGEDNSPPEYGKVYISIKTQTGEELTDAEKTVVLDTYIIPRSVVSIQPVVVNPNLIDISVDVQLSFDPNITNLAASGIEAAALNAVTQYNDKNLQLFGGVFRSSNLARKIEDSQVAIISNQLSIRLRQNIDVATTTNHVVKFNQKITDLELNGASKQLVTSTKFTYNNALCLLADYWNASKGEYIVRIVQDETGVVMNPNVGSVDATNGIITLTNFVPLGVDTIDVISKPHSPDIKPLRNDILNINLSASVFKATEDSFKSGGVE